MLQECVRHGNVRRVVTLEVTENTIV
jgi:hypothetical protein